MWLVRILEKCNSKGKLIFFCFKFLISLYKFNVFLWLVWGEMVIWLVVLMEK